jgi:hypothetical protein
MTTNEEKIELMSNSTDLDFKPNCVAFSVHEKKYGN